MRKKKITETSLQKCVSSVDVAVVIPFQRVVRYHKAHTWVDLKVYYATIER